MLKKLKNTDVLFAVMLLAFFILHILFLNIPPFSDDESHYATVPFRLMMGDSLVKDEWHLTQFASLFSYLPVRIWTAIKGSTDGLYIFLRCVYLAIHTSVSVLIYGFFKKYGKWAILASMIFFVQPPYNILAISYQSVFVISLLLLSMCLLAIYEKKAIPLYILAGVSFGCACVCNPLFCVVYVLYLLGCVLWIKRESIKSFIISSKSSNAKTKGKVLTKKQKREFNKQQAAAFSDMENYTCFFTGKAVLWTTCGILIVAVIAVAFFLSTGGTFESIPKNIENLLNSTEYDIASSSILSKFIKTLGYFNKANFYVPFILPIMFTAMFLDKNRKSNSHRFGYLLTTIVWSIIFMIAVLAFAEIYLCAISLPFYVFSIVCYLLTENKNKTMFYCMFAPCSLAAFIQYLAADTHWGAIGIVLAVCNVAGVFFARDLWKEMRPEVQNDEETTANKNKTEMWRKAIIVGFCVQMLFSVAFHYSCQHLEVGAVRAEGGPYSGMYMSPKKNERYNKILNDLDYIKSISKEDEPVLVASYKNWMYVYLERPTAIYSTWYRGTLDYEQLSQYYKGNPNQRPKYIYIESEDPQGATVQTAREALNEMFVFKQEDLSNGALLIVEY